MKEENHPKLEKALRALAKEEIFVPRERDERMLGAIRAHFEEPTAVVSDRPRLARRRTPSVWQHWLPLAAAIVIAGLILYFARPTERQMADLNRDGTVDVIDALLMAKEVQRGKGSDINHDQKIDARDAEEIATLAVRLERGPWAEEAE
ncbi:MAG: hypothetical protein GC138_08775 [Gammaproteobacteria bacterium]|nr:hypothetical protein [Gammaproteobacteria bacterium]